MSLGDDHADEEQCHDDGAHRRRGTAVEPRKPNLAEDRDKRRAQRREQCIDEP